MTLCKIRQTVYMQLISGQIFLQNMKRHQIKHESWTKIRIPRTKHT